MGFLARIGRRFAQLNQANCNDAWQGVSLTVRYRPAILEGLARLGIFIVKEAFAPSVSLGRSRVVVVVGTMNNYRSAVAAFDGRSDVRLAAIHNFSCAGCARISLLGQYLTGLWIIPLLPFILFLERRPHVRLAMTARLDQLVLTFGWGRGIRRALKKAGPGCVTVTSCLTVHQNLVSEQARILGIPTLFITHAPIGRGQMALTTEHAFLDGEFQRRLFPDSATRIRLTGSARGQMLADRRIDRSDCSGIVIATNTLIRDLDEIETLIFRLRTRYGNMPVAVRPHPRDRERIAAHHALCRRTGSRFNDPSEPLGEGLDDCRYLATCQSGVVVDALLLGFHPLILRSPMIDRVMSAAPEDYYGYAQLDLARDLAISDPRLPEGWSPADTAHQIDLAAKPGWDSRAEIWRGIQEILTLPTQMKKAGLGDAG